MNSLRAGFAKIAITPPPGADLTGFIARANPSEGVRDPLHVRTAVLEVGRRRILIVGLDCLGLEIRLRNELLRGIERQTGLHWPNVSVWCTHTHSGPATIPLLGCGELDWPYLRGRLLTSTVEAARRAINGLRPASAQWSTCHAGAWQRYRRPHGKSGGDAGLVDPAVSVLWLTSARGAPLGCFWFFAAHPTFLCSRLVSADWPGVAAAKLEREWGGVALFGQGCCGDVAPVRLDGADPPAAVDIMGQAIGDLALAARANAMAWHIGTIDARAGRLALPLMPPPSRAWFARHARQQRRQARDLESGVSQRAALAMARWASQYVNRPAPRRRLVDIQALRFGPLRLAVLPFEPLSAIGHAIRHALPEPSCIVGYANGCHAYLAPASQYEAGGYEIEQAYRYYGLPSVYQPTAAVRVVDRAVALARAMGGAGGFTHRG